MADFRRLLTVLAVLAVVACTASAQVGFATGSSGDLLACTATAAGTPELRPESFTDLAGDIIIKCTGGSLQAPGTVVPTANIVVYTSPSVPITSRYLQAAGQSEVLLIVDEAGSAIGTGSAAYGPKAPQTLCTSDQQQDHGGVNNGSSCTPYVAQEASTGYFVSVTTPGGTTAAKNVYQGKIGDFGANSVAFYNVPVLPPASQGVSRTFRITNIRVPVSPAYSSGVTFLLNATISTSPSAVLPITGNNLNIGIAGNVTKSGVNSVSTFQQCIPANVNLASKLVFTEGFATAFKTRVVPDGALNGTATGSNTAWLSTQTNTGGGGIYQNIPGGLYSGFAANSESGFIYPSLTNTVGSGPGAVTYTAGLADFGTRLKAVFTNIPAGLTLYVSTTSTNPNLFNTTGTTVPIIGGTSVFPFAVLVSTSSTDSKTDGSGISNLIAATAGGNVFPPSSPQVADGTLGAVAIANPGTATAYAVWEVVNADPSAVDTLEFHVYVSYTAGSATTANPYGTPVTGIPPQVLPPGAGTPTVNLSLAPEPGDGLFTTSSLTGVSLPIPRFAITNPSNGRFLTVGLCQTTLLFPYVTGQAGFDTSMAIANTSADPFGTVNQTGSCSLWAYGVMIGATGSATPFSPTGGAATIPGCDLIPNPLPGVNCFGGIPTTVASPSLNIPAGQVGYINAATPPGGGTGPLAGFQGYVIAVCNFQYAHGYAAVTDLGLRNLWSSYLALELTPGGVGSPRNGVAGIENLVH